MKSLKRPTAEYCQLSIVGARLHVCVVFTRLQPHSLSATPRPQDLLCYLACLAKYSERSSAEGLADVLGPVLLDPESCTLPVDADTLTGAAIWVVETLIRWARCLLGVACRVMHVVWASGWAGAARLDLAKLGRRDGECMHRGLRPAAGRVHSHADRCGPCSLQPL